MQQSEHRPDYHTVDDPSVTSALDAAGNTGTAISILEPYNPPNPPDGLPHVVRLTNVDGVASMAVAMFCELCKIGSKNNVERWIELVADSGILNKQPRKGGKDRNWKPLTIGHPDTIPIITLAEARRRIEELEPELVLLRDGISSDAFPALPTTWADTVATHPRSYCTLYPAVFLLLLPTLTPESVSSPHFWPVPCRPVRKTSTATPSEESSGGTATCGPPSARPWCRGR